MAMIGHVTSFSEDGDGIHAIHLVHHQIHRYEVELVGSGKLQGLHTARSLGNRVTFVFKHACKHLSNTGIVIDDQKSPQAPPPVSL